MTIGRALSTAVAGTSSGVCLSPDPISLGTFAGLTDGAGAGSGTHTEWNSNWTIEGFVLRFHFTPRVCSVHTVPSHVIDMTLPHPSIVQNNHVRPRSTTLSLATRCPLSLGP